MRRGRRRRVDARAIARDGDPEEQRRWQAIQAIEQRTQPLVKQALAHLDAAIADAPQAPDVAKLLLQCAEIHGMRGNRAEADAALVRASEDSMLVSSVESSSATVASERTP